MTEATAGPAPRVRPISGLLTGPAITAAGLALAPRMRVSENVAAAMTFAAASATGLLPLALAANARMLPRPLIALAAASILALAGIFIASPDQAVAALVVNLALLALAHATGGSIGRRVSHPGHLLPACAVAGAFDAASVFHPHGPSHAIARSARALTIAAVAFPVPGTRNVAPSLGVGDLVFMALVLGAAAAHRISILRTTACLAVGLVAAGTLAAGFHIAVPALVPLGAAVVIGLPEARRLRREDRSTAAIAVTVALGVLAAAAAKNAP